MLEHIQLNAELTIQELRPLSGMDFGYNRESVEWLEGHIERMRLSGQFDQAEAKNKLVSVYGSFFGECLVRCYGGTWVQRDGVWCADFGNNNFAFPFNKVSKQMKNGLEDSIGSMFRAVPTIFKDRVCLPLPRPKKPWWKFW